jgi:GT2 family glycosyltransferase
MAALEGAGASGVGVVQGQTLPDPTIERGRWSATQELTDLTGRYEACNIFYRVDALEAGGGFDDAVGFFGEDTAAGWAVLEAGWLARYEPAALVHHTVTHPGLGWHLRRALGYGNINALVRRFPAMRTELLWHRYFLRSRNAAFAAAVLGLLFGVRKPRLLALALPYAWIRKPKGRSRRALADAAGAATFDAAVFCGLVRGSIRERTLVL